MVSNHKITQAFLFFFTKSDLDFLTKCNNVEISEADRGLKLRRGVREHRTTMLQLLLFICYESDDDHV